MRAIHRSVIFLVVLALVLLGAGFANSKPATRAAAAAAPTRAERVPLARAADAPFDAHGSVNQVWLTGAGAGQLLKLVNSKGIVVQRGRADAQGSKIFREVKRASGYHVVGGSGTSLVATGPLRVTNASDVPGPEFYAKQPIGAGY